ncbi:DEAD/DEAH box helicase [Sulfurimonas sp. HSL3-7]|uniref:DEAD/DEAH box helicase n=1 Tax=Sulfonitrofixus jiaomeiensis TaxID=3131938 RepID=UPI0031F7D164
MNIQIDVLDNAFVLKGDLEAIKNKRRARSNFESIGASFNDVNQIVIPFSTEKYPNEYDDEEKQYAAVLRLLDKFSIPYQKTDKAQDLVHDMDRENDNFNKFSIKAKRIRNNEHGDDDFENFTNVIESKLKRELYDLQLLSGYHLAYSQNACNFSVPGAGKTSIVYSAYAYLKSLPITNSKHVDRLLIICPLAAFAPWKNEYVECFGKGTSVRELVGVAPYDRKAHFYSDDYTEITLISYQSASSESDIENIKAYLNRNKVMVVLDEAHKIKNVTGGKQAEAILSIAKYATARVVLTGTPAPNGYQDLYNLYKFIWPSKNVIGFPVNYLQMLSEEKTPKALQDIKILIENISPFFIRVKKSDLNLPDPIENEPIMVSMSKSQKVIYEYIEKKYIDYFEQETSTDSFINKLQKAKLVRLMQCVTNPKLLNKALDSYLDEEGLSSNLNVDDKEVMKLIKSYNPQDEIPPKFLAIKELLNKIFLKDGADGKVIIWTIFVQNIFDLKDYLKDLGIECELLFGGTPNENDDTPEEILTREKIIERFHRSDCPFKVIIANPFAVGESISLHKACHNAIYLEKNFNASMYMQSKDRVHRYGLDQEDVVNYYYLLSTDTVDQTIHSRILEKEKRMLELIEGEDIPLLNLNMEDSSDGDEDDIRAIIRDYHDRKTARSG